MNQELKVGIVVSIGLIIFAGLIIGVGGIKFGEKGYRIKVLFDYVSGLDNHASVRLSGMECGEVKKMTLKDGRVQVDIWLKEEAKVYADATITINTLGLLGEAYIEIDPGTKGSQLKDQDVIVGKDPTQMSEILLKGEEIVRKLDRAMSKIDNMLGGEGSKAEIGGMIKDIKETLDHLNKGIDKVSNSFLNIEKGSDKVLKEIDQVIAENREGIKGATSGLEKGAKRFNQVLSNLDEAVSESKTSAGETLAGFNQTVRELKVTLNSVHDLVQQVESEDGILSKMIYDKEMANNLAALIKHLNNLAADLEKNPWKLMRKN